MKAKMNNTTHIEGLLYQHSLESKVSGPNSTNPGTEFITGTIEIATDNAVTNIVPVHFTYVTATTAKGTANATYATLMNIVNGTYGSVMKDGADKAIKLRIDSAIGLNEFFSDRNGKEELVSVKRNEGGFVHVVNALDDNEANRSTFDVDMIINSVTVKEGDPDAGTVDKAIIKGAIFDFRKSLLPIELSATDPRAISYFEGLEVTPNSPVFTRLKGSQISETITRTIEEESAFGAPSVREVKSTRKDFVITWAATTPYEWDSEDSILVSELKDAITTRETYLATLKKRNDEYKANRGNALGGAAAPKAAATTAPAPGGFNF